MKKWIYKITNQINGKVYIGQTNDLERRQKEHWSTYDRDQPLYQAFNKYGRENFKMEPIEETEEYDAREIYWIDYYNSYGKGGYNATRGGQTSGDAERVYDILSKHYEEILQKIAWTQQTLYSICEEYGFSDPVVDKINRGGYNQLFPTDYVFPIRSTGTSLSHYLVKEIQKEIHGNLPFQEISKKYSVGHQFLADVNAGRKHRNSSFKYPIRRVNPIPKSLIREMESKGATPEELLESYNITKKRRFKNNPKKTSILHQTATCID